MIFHFNNAEDTKRLVGLERGTLFASYKGFETKIKYSEEDGVYYGKLEGLYDLVNFEGDSLDDALKNFYEAVDDYLTFVVTDYS